LSWKGLRRCGIEKEILKTKRKKKEEVEGRKKRGRRKASGGARKEEGKIRVHRENKEGRVFFDEIRPCTTCKKVTERRS